MVFTANSLVVAGSFCLVVSLMEAWLLSGLRYSQIPAFKSVFPGYQYLLKSHIDFILMAGLLFIFFLLFQHFGLNVPPFVIVCMCVGSVLNPSGFLALAVKPDLPQKPTTFFGALMSLSFVTTTVGYVGASWLVACAALGV